MHQWKFFRMGGLDQVVLRDGSDIASLSELDQKLWTALSCPTQGIRFDQPTLELLDADNDKKIRVPDILAAIEWLKPRLVSLDVLMEATDALQLTSINTTTPEGRSMLKSIKRALSNLGKRAATAISLTDAVENAGQFMNIQCQSDGVVSADATEDASVSQVINEIIETFGAESSRCGKAGVTQAKSDAFFAAIESYLAWRKQGDDAAAVLGDKTAAAVAAVHAVHTKIEDYFTRCRLSAFDARAAGPLNRSNADFAVLATQNLTEGLPAIAAFPLAQIEADHDLPLLEGVNPAWQAAISTFKTDAVEPLMGAECRSLSYAQWQELKAKLAPFAEWTEAKKGAEVEGLGEARLTAIATGSAQTAIAALIVKAKAVEAENAKINDVVKLLRYKTYLVKLLNNFVNMSQFYDPEIRAIFQVGTLYIDARASQLCFHVDNVDAHSAQAATGKCCLAYCRITRSGMAEPQTICAAVTAGFAESLWVGRNGIFYDIEGRDWDATIIKMVDHAISIKEAFWSPWRKITAMIGGQVQKMLAGKQEAMLAGASKMVEGGAAPKKMEGAALASSVAAIGIAIGLIGSAVGGLVSAISGLPFWKVVLGIIIMALVVSGPSMILTWFKLRARNMAPILNACGWAVNRNLRFSLKLGRLFTAEAKLPEKAELQLSDPYADDNSARNRIIVLVCLVILTAALWYIGLLDNAVPRCMRRNTVSKVELHSTPVKKPF